MMKKFTLIYAMILTIFPCTTINSQPWEYNFGTGTGVYNTLGQSTTFLPNPPSGTALVAVCSGGSSINLENPGVIGFGNATELRITAKTTVAVNKFSIIEINSAAPEFTIQFDIRFSGNSGIFQFFNGSPREINPITFTDTTFATNPEIFSGLSWTLSSSDSITTRYRPSNSWQPLVGSSFVKDVNYVINIYANNSGSTRNYSYKGSQTVAADKWDLWVNGVLIGNDLSKPSNGIPNETAINAFTFVGTESAGTIADLLIDNIIYTNQIAPVPLPVEYTSLTTPDKFKLSQNYPNPFNPSTRIEFSVTYASKVRIDVYDILGQHIRTLINEELEEGYHHVIFDASGAPAGTYIYRIIANNFIQSRKMIFLK
jgi:hypothetical protein